MSRYADETVGLVSMKICGAGVVTAADACARAALEALADAGLLLPPGGESREVYDVQTRGVQWPGFDNEAAAWHQLANVKAWAEKPKVRIVRRTITEWPDGRRHVSPGEHVGGDVLEAAS